MELVRKVYLEHSGLKSMSSLLRSWEKLMRWDKQTLAWVGMHTCMHMWKAHVCIHMRMPRTLMHLPKFTNTCIYTRSYLHIVWAHGACVCASGSTFTRVDICTFLWPACMPAHRRMTQYHRLCVTGGSLFLQGGSRFSVMTLDWLLLEMVPA